MVFSREVAARAGWGLPGLLMAGVLCMGAGCANEASREAAPVQTAPALPSDEPAAGPSTTEGESDAEFKTTPSGLKYRILKESDGKKPTAADTVKVHYRGWLDNGTEFDSSYKRGEPIEFPLGGVIPGWTEGLQLVGEGGKIELEIPSRLGYGDFGSPPTIPGGATLHFAVELLEVK